jgi:hypothetical protein
MISNMTRRIVALLFFCPLVFAVRVTAQTPVIEVTADGNGPGSRIAAAIASAAVLHQKTGAVDLLLNPGIYSGRFEKPEWITLTGKDREKCIIVYDRSGANFNICRQWGEPRATNLTLKIIVAADGSGAFSDIASALRSVGRAAQAAPVDIIIKPGTYRETVKTHDWINLIGEDREKCIITDAGASGANPLSVLTVASNTKILNLTVLSEQAKHIINSDQKGIYSLAIENCTFRRTSPVDELKTPTAAVTAGLQGGQQIYLLNYIVEDGLPICVHNWKCHDFPCRMALGRYAGRGYNQVLQVVGFDNNVNEVGDYFYIHDTTLYDGRCSVCYFNKSKVKQVPHGLSEVILVGSGNINSQVKCAETKSGHHHRQRSGNPGTALKY